MQIHELNNYTGLLGAGAFLAVDNGNDTGKLSTQDLLQPTEIAMQEIEETLNARIDNIIGGGTAPSAAEVADARLGAAALGSKSYPSLGDAIRGQVTELNAEYNRSDPKKNINVSGLARSRYFIVADGTVSEITGNSVIIPVKSGNIYTIKTTDQWGTNYALLKDTDFTVGSTPDYATGYSGRVMVAQNVLGTFQVPADAKYAIIRCDSDEAQSAISIYEYYSIVNNIDTLDNATMVHKAEDIDDYSREDVYINASNIWAAGNNVSKTVFIPAIPGQTVIFKCTYQWGSVYALLKDATRAVGSAPHYCTDFPQRYLISSGQEVTFTVPDDCQYIAIRADNGVSATLFNIQSYTPLLSYTLATMRSSLKINSGTNVVYIAASNSSDRDKESADIVCTGSNDEILIQAAINSIFGVKPGIKICFMPGDYYIDSFPNTNYDGHVAIMLPSKQSSDTIGTDVYSVTLEGTIYNSEDTVFHVTQAAYDDMNSTDFYSVFAAENDYYYNHYAFHDLRVYVPSAQKKIVCYDGRRMGSMEARRLKAIALDHATWDTPVEDIVLPNFYSIGVAGACWDSNSWNYIWESIYCIGFGQGFAVGGEHLLAIKCVAVYGRHGFTFHANMDPAKISAGLTPSHPDTLIDCSDEANANFWLFGGDNTRRPIINCYNLSVEYWSNWFSIAGAGNFSTEEDPGQFSGFISYAISGGDVTTPFWANGSGRNFTTVNLNQVKQTTSAIRRTYAPNIGQQIYDTDVNKLLVCTNPDSKEWRDAMGNIVA